MIESALRAGSRQFEYSEIRKNGLSQWDKPFFGAAGQIRTADLVITNDALYRLSYSSIAVSNSFIIIARIGKKSSLFSRLFFQFGAYYIPRRDQTVERPGGIGGAGGREAAGRAADLRLYVPLVERHGFFPVDIDLPDLSMAENWSEIIGNHIADTAVRRTDDITGLHHIPQCHAISC